MSRGKKKKKNKKRLLQWPTAPHRRRMSLQQTLLSEVDHGLFGHDLERIGAARAVLDELHGSKAALAERSEDLEVRELEVCEQGVLIRGGVGATATTTSARGEAVAQGVGVLVAWAVAALRRASGLFAPRGRRSLVPSIPLLALLIIIQILLLSISENIIHAPQ